MKRKFGRTSRSYMKLAVFIAAVLILCAAANIFLDYSYAIGAIETAAAFIILCAAAYGENKRRNDAENYIRSVTKSAGNLPSNALEHLPVPMVVTHADGTVDTYDKVKDGVEKVF